MTDQSALGGGNPRSVVEQGANPIRKCDRSWAHPDRPKQVLASKLSGTFWHGGVKLVCHGILVQVVAGAATGAGMGTEGGGRKDEL